jgi:hypothetical protein
MRHIALAIVIACTGCGRIGFDPFGPGMGGDDGIVNDAGLGDGNANGSDGGAGLGPQLVDSAHVESASATNAINVPLSGTLLANDTIVVSIGWHDGTSTISSVNDSRGNSYMAGTTIQRSNNTLSQNVYSTFVTAAGTSDTISVSFSQLVPQGSVRVVVYRGVDTSQTLVFGGGGGAGTTNAQSVALVQKVNSVVLGTDTADVAPAGPGTGFATRLTTTFSDIVEDKVATATGFQTVAIPLGASGNWVLQSVMLPP